MRHLLVIAACVAALGACGDNGAKVHDDAGVSIDAPMTDAAADAGDTFCLDRPNELARAPTGGLPCDLRPPTP